ncbi:hypothetical protein KSP40_PGU000772 [Platanthera guangdongensis]|uniref:Uncharacterized protein n=1 Tax=Platanthera guangdongensis TaxID=2320717 RepID=A0ABR2LPB8_9ASPA
MPGEREDTDNVIEINAHTDTSSMVDITEDKDIDVEFMYSVKWKETVTPFEKRMENASANWIPRHDPNESFEE